MRGKLALIVVIVLVAGVGTIAVLTGSSPAQPVTAIKVIEHAVTDKVTDVGKTGDSPGDLLTFHNKVYDEADATVVGRDQGSCVRISPSNSPCSEPIRFWPPSPRVRGACASARACSCRRCAIRSCWPTSSARSTASPRAG